MIDILIPHYGNSDFLFNAVESVFAQDSPDWNLIVVNDADPDRRVDKYFSGLKDPRVRYVRNPVNLGVSKNFNECLKFAQSEYCVFLGNDDLISSNFVSTLKNKLFVENKIVLFHSRAEIINEDGNSVKTVVDFVKYLLSKLVPKGIVHGRRISWTLLIGNWMYFPGIVWRTELLRSVGFREDLNVCQDLFLLLKLLDDDINVLISHQKLIKYRRHKGSFSSLTLFDHKRFLEERMVYEYYSSYYRSQHLWINSLLARLRIMSRLHALLIIMKSKDKSLRKNLANHVIRL